MSIAIKSPPVVGLTQKRALLAERLRKAVSEPRQSPLSFAQQRLWFLDQLEPNSPLYNIGSVARVEGNLNLSALQQALDAVVARHEVLRTRFICPDESPVQVIDPQWSCKFRVVDLTSQSEETRAGEADRLVRAEVNRPFSLSADHPLRATLLQLRPDEHRLVLVLHHIAADEWSLKVLFKELVALYASYVQGQPQSLPELPIQFADYARWQRQWLRGDVLQRELQYWKKQLGACPPATELPTDHPRGLAPTFNGGNATRALGQALTEGLRDLATTNEATLFMVLLAAFKALICRYTQQEDLVVGSLVAGRNRVETEGLIGFFVNTLALRTSVAGDPTFEQFLARVREVTIGAMAHQELPFERVVEELQPERTLSHLPFTKLMFAFQTGSPEQLELPGARLRFLDVESDLAKFDVTLVLRDTSQGLVAKIEYNTDLFEPDTISRLLLHLETLLQGIVGAPARPLSQLPMLTPAERHQLFEWNQTTTAYPRDRCIHELFEAQVTRAPESIAVAWGHQKMSYGELNSRANQLARFLKQFDIRPDVPIGLCTDRSLEMVVGMLGILKAGGAYVPLDAKYPKERLAFMLNDTDAPVVLTQQRLLARVPRTAKVICLDADWEIIAREPRENTANLATARNLAYIMYTSGSTGQPKGVAVPHRAVNRLVLNTEYIHLSPSDRIAQVSNISFDAATFELWGALLNGAQLVGITRDIALSPKDFAAELRAQGITAMFLTAALFNQLASETPGAFETLRTVIAGGEALEPKWVRAVLRNRPPQRLVNGYGPTENTTFTCSHLLRKLGEEVLNVPIGRPISNTTVYILDSHLNPVPIGIRGELYTGGDGLARGYWNRPELTAEKFIPNPFDETGETKLYRTGDLARYLPDGTIEFLGRIDGQVKIRGFRVELGEIETLLARHPAIRDCVVTVSGTNSLTKRLVGYVVPAAEQVPNASELRGFLLEKLPEYMIPSAFVSVGAFPLTPNGKVDRKALPAPDQARPPLDRQYVQPRDTTEQQLAAIWENILGVRPIGILDKFFDLGGHSMLAVRVIAQIEKAFRKKLRLATLFQAPTIERLAAVLRGDVKESGVAAGTSLVEIQSQGTRPPLFLVHGAGGGMFWGYINLSRRLGTEQPVYGFKSRGLDGREELAHIEDLAGQYISDLRTVQPRGPYYLGGYCFGGNVAYEMARQLTAQGEEVAFLAVLNCAPPNSRYTRIPWTPQWALKFTRNLLHWATYFGHWSTTQRREFFRWKWQLFKKRVTRTRSKRAGELSKVEPGDLVDLSSYTEEQKTIWETHIRALMSFCPEPYDGCLHLFRSPGHPLWCSFDADYGWGELAKGGVKVITVPGAHEQILEEPWVKVLAEELSGALCRAQEVPKPAVVSPEAHRLTALPQRGTELAAAEEPALSPDIETRQLEYWKRQLEGAPELLDLPGDRPRPAQSDHADARRLVSVDSAVQKAVEGLATTQECESFAIFLAAFAAVLHRYTRNGDIIIGSVAAKRPAPAGDITAAFENPVALRCDLTGEPTFRELIRRLTSTTQQALAHSAIPFGKVVAALRPQQSACYTPIFQVSLRVKDEPLADAAAGRLSFSSVASDNQKSRFDLSLQLVRNGQGFAGCIEYRTALFDHSRIARMAEHFEVLLKSAVENPDRPLSRLALLPEHEVKRLLVEWTATEHDYPKHKTLIDLFREQASRTPDAEALICGSTRLTYSRLYARAAQVARQLKAMGVTTESLVGICLDRTPDMVASVLGTMLAGGAYVPMDPKYPKERLLFILEDSKVKVLLTQSNLLGSLSRTNSAILCLDTLDKPADDAQREVFPTLAGAANVAYLIYTSGSTGKPKGVALEHRSAVALVSWAKEAFTPEELSGVLASTSICFDLSVFELFVPLCWGGKVILAENALALPTLSAAGEVRLINTVPSAIGELLRLRAVPKTVQVINLAGEPLSTELVDQIYRETSVQKVYDLYGPTETTTYSTGGLRKSGEPATIGRPLANEHVYLLDAGLSPVPIGIPGELFIGGDGLARCYLNRPELTDEKFIPHPFKQGARLYRTGDLARWREDGTLEFLGRLDHQVKIRGFRIELGEIEVVLKSQPAVQAVVVVVREDHPGDKRLVAYVVSRPDASVTAEDLRVKIREQLPDFMMPSDFVFLKALPMTPNGKIDRKALPAPEDSSNIRRSDLVAPRTALEQQLADIWRDVLRLKQVSIYDNFFDLGGHSLLAARVISEIRDACKLEVPFSVIFSAPTIAALAEVLASTPSSGQAVSPPVARVERTGRLPVSYVQERLWFLDQLEPGSAAYNVPTALRLSGPLDIDALRHAVNELVSRHEALRTTFRYEDDGLAQIIAVRLPLEISYIDLRSLEVKDRQNHAQELANRDARRPFDLTSGPLIRISLFALDETDHLLLVVMHHSISDGWSLAQFFQELGALYDAFTTGRKPSTLASMPLQYVDFAQWQRRWMQGAMLERELAHWKTVLEGAPAELDLPLDHSRPDRPSGRAGCRAVPLGKAAVRRVMDAAGRESCTPFMIFLAALMISLRNWTGREDLVIGTVVAGRTRKEFENILGCFMNFLPLRSRIRDSDIGRELLRGVRTAVLEAQNHQDCPFEKIVEAINPQRRLDRNPLYNIALLLQNFPQNLFPTEKLQAASMPVSLEAALLDLRFEIEQVAEGLSLACEYKTDLFEPGTVEAQLSSWVKVIETLVSSPETKVADFEINSALTKKPKAAAQTPPTPTIAISATFTCEPVREPLGFWLKRLEIAAGIEFAPYHQVFQQLLDPAGLFATNRHGLNVVLSRLEDWEQPSTVPGQAATLTWEQSIEQNAVEFARAIKTAARRESAPLLICFTPPSFGLAAKATRAESLSRIQRRLEEQLASIAGVYLLKGEELAKWYPVEEYYDASGEELGHVPYTPLFFTALGTALARKFHALNRPAYKVIALDCDHTLWSGVCGEEGPKGILLDGPRRALQEFMRDQREKGMLLCLCSKNNEEDVRAVFTERPEMPLRSEHFAASRLSWRSKSENLKSLALELGLGLDSFIFLDDNPVECAEVEANCQEVLTLLLPEDPARIERFLNHCWAFDHLKLTAEDRQRSELYRQNLVREKLRAEASTLEDFLAELELKVQIDPISPEDWSRVAQLTQRTNQFNLTTRRIVERELGQLLDSCEGLVVRVSDRFGDYGLVGAILYRVETDSLVVDSFLLSCRVLGRGVEHQILARLGRISKERGASWVALHFVPTAKNKPALDFLEHVGSAFKQPLNGGSVFRLPVDLAASLEFHPSAKSEEPETAAAPKVFPLRARSAPAVQSSFFRYGKIALEANDAAKIHQEVRNGVSVRKGNQINYVSPKGELERRLCLLWEELLHVQPVGVQDDFFELGGHSLLAVRLFTEIEKLIGHKFPLVTLFQAPTIRQLARVLEQKDSAGSLLVRIQPEGTKSPLFLIHGAGGDVLWGYANLAAYLPPDQPIYGIKSHSVSDSKESLHLEEMARAYLEVVRMRQPQGPYHLGGYCFGGNVAYEMARQLQMQGHEVALVALIDTAPANAGYETLSWWQPAFPWRFARNLRYWLADFIALEPHERHRFMERKLRWVGRKLKRRFGLDSSQARFDLEEVIDPRNFPEHELKLWQSHLEALIAHVERPYAGRVALLRTRGQPLFCSLEEDFCWSKLVKGGVAVRCIPGSHENIFMEPNVRVLASELSKLLDEARSQVPASRQLF